MILNPNALLISSATQGILPGVKEALDGGADIHALDKTNWNALMYSLYLDHLGVAQYLISQGATLPGIAYTSNNLILRLQEKKYNDLVHPNN